MKSKILLLAAFGLTVVSLSYGVKPDTSLPFLFGFEVNDIDLKNIFRAYMVLYWATAIFWFIGARSAKYLDAAFLHMTLFMAALATGRIMSFMLDGADSPVMYLYTFLEVVFALIGFVLIVGTKKDQVV